MRNQKIENRSQKMNGRPIVISSNTVIASEAKQSITPHSSLLTPHFSLLIVFFFLFQFSIFNLHAQKAERVSDLRNLTPDWTAVIGGEAVSPCIETSYGVAVLSDGRLLSACTENGTVIWQRNIRGRPSPYISSFGDFLFVVTDRTHLNFVNPSGLTLWTAVCPFEIADFPIVARDGRVFVRGKKGIACYGLDGKRKWHDSTEELGSLPIGFLDDGSLLLFLKNAKNNQTIANHYSPFGEKLDDVTFSAIVSSAENCENGVLVSLKNGSLGLVVIVEGTSADTKWVNGSGNPNGAFKICYSENTKNAAYFFQNGIKTEAVIVKTETGEILNRFQVGNIAPKDFKLARASASGFFISGAYTACEFSEGGSILYAATLPENSKWTSLFYTRKNYIVLCMKDWSVKAFLMSETQNASHRQKSQDLKEISLVEVASFDSAALALGIRPLTNQKMAQISKDFEDGDYGTREKEYLSLIKTEAENYIASCTTESAFRGEDSSNFFAENAVYTQNLLYLMSKTGSREFSLLFAKLLSSEMDSSQILSVITFAGETGYDEDGKMLLALQKLVMKSSSSDATLLKAVCDSTYQICRFMGRPALNKRGKDILSYLFLPQFDKNVNTYARKTLEKMIDLEKKR